MKNSEYWKKRFEQLEEAKNNDASSLYRELDGHYSKAQRTIEGQIQAWYQRFSVNNKITMAEARKLLNTKELAELKWDVKEYIKYGEQNELNQMWMTELENASARYHISRLEALKLQTQQSLEVLFGNQIDGIHSMMKKLYTDGYYHTAYEIQKGWNIGWDISSIDQNKFVKIISKPWAVDGKNFSERLWGNKSKLVNELHGELTQMTILGRSPDQAIGNIAAKMKTSKQNAGRLVMTESSYFASASQRDAFNDLDVERFEIVATLDSHTSAICQDLDGHVFNMKDYEPGVTAPPFHVWCRSTTVPYFDDEFNIGERAARGEDGKTYYVPDSMKYPEWKKTFVDGGSKEGLKPAETKNIVEKPLFPKEITGVMRGQPMTFDDANGGRANPKFEEGGGYTTNCQSCVVANEARRRGFDVEALPRTRGSMLEKLALDSDLAWIDPITNEKAIGLTCISKNANETFKFLQDTIEENARYTFRFDWKGKNMGHIICADKVDNVVRLYDPQSGTSILGDDVVKYLDKIKNKVDTVEKMGGLKVELSELALYQRRPRLLRVDTLEFNTEVVEKIMKGVD